jgi:hypothetical protein
VNPARCAIEVRTSAASIIRCKKEVRQSRRHSSYNAPGATADVAWLKLHVASSRGSGVLAGITTVQRINTDGGNSSIKLVSRRIP